MSLYVNTTLIGIFAFIMIFTYVAEGIVFMEYNSSDYNSFSDFDRQVDLSNQTSISDVLSFDNWLKIQWTIAYYKVRGDTSYIDKYKDLYNSDAVNMIINDCPNYHPINDGCQCAVTYWELNEYMTWYNLRTENDENFGNSGIGLKTQQDLRYVNYYDYLKDLGFTEDDGVLKPYQKNLLENAMDFLGKIPDGIAKFFDLVSFNIKDKYGQDVVPGAVRIILLMFFIPMQIILLIEILPLIAKIIEAIGSLIPF